jgi:hypothetical protein
MKMKTLLNIWIVFVLILITSVALLSIWGEDKKLEVYNNNARGSYYYDIEITTDSPMSNVIFYMPLPMLNNTSSMEQDLLNSSYNNQRVKWEIALVETEHGPMLSMRTDQINPRFYSRPEDGRKVIVDGQEEIHPLTSDEYSEKTPIPFPIDFAVIVFVNDTINTKNPVGNAEVLMPRYNSTNLGAITSYRNAISYSYDSRIYAHYEASPDARVQISISLDGQNEWWIGGAHSNSYREYIAVKLRGSQNGWTTVKGELVTGEGTYLDE